MTDNLGLYIPSYTGHDIDIYIYFIPKSFSALFVRKKTRSYTRTVNLFYLHILSFYRNLLKYCYYT